jgi:type I restriction enzyme S subunit
MPIGSFATFSRGSGLAKSDLTSDGAHPCIHYGELFTRYGAVIDTIRSRTNRDLPVKSAIGDVLMPTSDVTPRGLAKASAIQRAGVGLGGDILIIKPDHEKADPRFLAYAIRHDINQVLALVRGSTVYHLYAADMRHFNVPCLPVAEQARVAGALSDVDQQIAGLERMIAKKQAIRHGMMQQLLTGKTRLPRFSGAWVAVPAGDIGTFKGGSGFPVRFQGASTGTYPFYKVSDMNTRGNERIMRKANHYIYESQRNQIGAVLIPKDAIVFAKVGAAIFQERKRILERPSCIDNNMAAFIVDPSKADFRFVHFSLSNFKMGSLVATTAMPSLNGGQLRSISLPLPPTMEEQQAIVHVLHDAGVEVDKLNRRLAKARFLKQGMMQELLTGRTALPLEAVP